MPQIYKGYSLVIIGTVWKEKEITKKQQRKMGIEI